MYKKISIPAIFSIISAVLLRLSFPKTGYSPLVFFAMVPFLLILLQTTKSRNAFLWGWFFGSSFYYMNIFWLNTLSTYNSFIPIGIVFLGILLGLSMGVFGWIGFFLHKYYPRFSFILLPCLWVLLEYIRNIGQLAFPWSYLSTTQWKNLFLIQVMDITGPWIISFLIVLVNIVLAQLILRILDFKSRKNTTANQQERFFAGTSLIPGICLVFLLFLLITGYGFLRIGKTFNGTQGYEIAILQPNIPQKIKFASYAGSDEERQTLSGLLENINFDMLGELQESGLDLVVMPESAFTNHYFAYNHEIQDRIGQEARRIGAGILLGADREIFYDKNGQIARTREEIEDIQSYNSAWYFLPNGKLYSECYDKIQLVPFGEHLPYFDLIPGFQRIIVQTGSFLKGSNYALFPLYSNPESMSQGADCHFSSVICFESSFGWLLRRFVKRGADFLIIITNDAWYEDSAGPYQHFTFSVIRAVETRRWIVRCSNRGISALISPKGEIIQQSALNEKASLRGMIYPAGNHSFYGKIGDLVVLPYVLTIAAAIAGIFIKKASKKISTIGTIDK
ncbi:apolipoprotein N-acyltransferase [Candidatus Sumerlaeota bacterium]|nr:apolipoprotein N-acyltransferase [Candidatus Sumerlaeota bacterium]